MKRVLLYSPDAVGMGHVRRLLKIADSLAQRLPGTAQLLVTGGATTQYLEQRAPGLDFVRLPSWRRVGPERYEPRDLPLPPAQLRQLREHLVLQCAVSFRPDLLLADHNPEGRGGELLPTLSWLRGNRPDCRIVLGMRDIFDDADMVRRVWAERRIFRILEEAYELILVYGEREIFDVAAAYGLPERAARKLVYCGYLGLADPVHPREGTRRELGVEGKFVVALAGGGADGFGLLSCFLDALPLLSAPVRSLVVTGPLMPREAREVIASRARNLPGCGAIEFVPDLPSIIAAADAVVSMLGYNVATELAALGKAAVVVPRTYPRREQLIRARIFAARGLIDLLPEEELGPRALADRVELQLRRPAHAGVALDHGGLDRVAGKLVALLADDLGKTASSEHRPPTETAGP
jgi:predicted glycosyltransferase